MVQKQIFDAYLNTMGSGKPEEEKRDLGNRIRSEARKAAEDWGPELQRFLPGKADVEELPAGSWLLRLEFTLAKPFTSKSESEIHPYLKNEIQNPLALDHLTGLPLVQPATWKGHLRFAAGMASIEENAINQLFGGDDGGQAARLHFFPTFFDSNNWSQGYISKEVATPLYRDTRTPVQGRAPINMEVIPVGTKGIFCLLYTPHPKGKDWSFEQTGEDLRASAKAVRATLLEYGFSARKTAGWGIAQNKLDNGKLMVKGTLSGETGPEPFLEPETDFFKFLDDRGAVKSNYLGVDGTLLSRSQYKKLREGDTAVFEKFKSWYREYGGEWVRRCTGKIVVREEQIDYITDLEKVVEDIISKRKGRY